MPTDSDEIQPRGTTGGAVDHYVHGHITRQWAGRVAVGISVGGSLALFYIVARLPFAESEGSVRYDTGWTTLSERRWRIDWERVRKPPQPSVSPRSRGTADTSCIGASVGSGVPW